MIQKYTKKNYINNITDSISTEKMLKCLITKQEFLNKI